MDGGIKEGILDIGRYPPIKGSKVFAALKGVVDAGVECPYDEDKLPSEDRLLGKHINKDIALTVDNIKSKVVGGK